MPVLSTAVGVEFNCITTKLLQPDTLLLDDLAAVAFTLAGMVSLLKTAYRKISVLVGRFTFLDQAALSSSFDREQSFPKRILP